MPKLCPKGIDLGVKPSAPSCPPTLPLYPGLQAEKTESQRTPLRRVAFVSVETQTEIQTALVSVETKLRFKLPTWRSKQLLSQCDLRLLWFQ